MITFVDLEWKMIYVGSAESEEYDQILDSVFVGPIPEGKHMFVFQVCRCFINCFISWLEYTFDRQSYKKQSNILDQLTSLTNQILFWYNPIFIILLHSHVICDEWNKVINYTLWLIEME